VTEHRRGNRDPTVSCSADYLSGLMRSTPHLRSPDGTAMMLPNGGSIGPDSNKLESRTVEQDSVHGAVVEHLRLRNWLTSATREHIAREPEVHAIEVSCGAASYAKGVTFGTHFNIEYAGCPIHLQEILPTLYLLGAPFLGSGALVFGTALPCWSAYLEARRTDRCFTLKEALHGKKRRLQIATSAGCHRSHWSLSLAFGWLGLVVEAIEQRAIDSDLPVFADLQQATQTYNRDMTLTAVAPTSLGLVTLLDCLDSVFPRLSAVAESEDLVAACRRVKEAIRFLRTQERALTMSHDPCILATLLDEQRARSGIDQKKLMAVNRALLAIAPVLVSDSCARPAIASALLERRSSLRSCDLTTSAQRDAFEILDSETLEETIALKARAEELYSRWSILGDGIFDRLDGAGLLTHRVPGLEESDDIHLAPPASPARARLRGQFVLAHADEPTAYACSWACLLDLKNQRSLNMSHPDSPDTDWAPIRKAESSWLSSDSEGLRRVLPSIEAYLRADNGDHGAAIQPRVTHRPRRAAATELAMRPVLRRHLTARSLQPSSVDDPIALLLQEKDLEPCFGIGQLARRNRVDALAERLSDSHYVTDRIQHGSFDEVANECARSVARLMQLDVKRFGATWARGAFAQPLLRPLSLRMERNNGEIGLLRESAWPVYQILGRPTANDLLQLFIDTARALPKLRGWDDPAERGACLAIQFPGEVQDTSWCLELCQAARENPHLASRFKVRHFIACAYLRHSYTCTDPDVREHYLNACITEVEAARALPSAERDSYRHLCLTTLGRAYIHLDKFCHFSSGSRGNATETGIRRIRERLQAGQSATALTAMAEGLWEQGSHDEAVRHARRACALEWFRPEAQALILSKKEADPTSRYFMPQLEEHMRKWTLFFTRP
jgi:hypothetical protein